MRASIRDIAREVGVSHVTVANVLNGRSKQASPATCQRVLNAARVLNYMPVARPSTQRRHVETRIIGLVYDRLDWNNFWGARAYEGLREGALEHGYDLLTILRQAPVRPVDQEELRFLDRRSDGLIFLMPQGRGDLFRMLVEHEVPTVACHMDDVPPGIASVVVDNQGSMRIAVRHLTQRGHRHLLFLSVQGSRADFEHRRQGYRDAVAVAGLKPRELLIAPASEWQAQVMRHVDAHGITAIVCSTDELALQLGVALSAAGRRVPEDISLVGMDDLPDAEAAGLTTIGFSSIELGRLAVDSMIHRIAGADAGSCHRIVPCHLVERRSVVPPAP